MKTSKINSIENAYEIIRLSEASQALALEKTKNFLRAWKAGVKVAGKEYFDVKTQDGEIDSAESRDDLQPKVIFIKNCIGKISHGEVVFLGLMVSFYNSECGQEILQRSKAANIADWASILDEHRKEIIVTLFQNASGW